MLVSLYLPQRQHCYFLMMFSGWRGINGQHSVRCAAFHEEYEEVADVVVLLMLIVRNELVKALVVAFEV